MAKKSAKSAAVEGKGAEALASVASPDSGVPLHSFEASRGPIESKASGTKEAFGIEEVGAEERKGKPLHIRSRVPTYSAQGKTFYSGDTTVYYQDDFTSEQWAAIRSNPNLVVSKAATSEE